MVESRGQPAERSESLVDLCDELLSGRGEASGVALASEILAKYADLTTGPRIAFFELLANRFGPDREQLDAAIAADDRVQVLYEAPNRVAATLADLAEACGVERPVAIAREITKVHEEVVRLPLGEAAVRAAGVEARGEHVIVVGPGVVREIEIDDAVLLDAVRAAVAAGASRRDAVSAVAQEHGVARRRVYELSLGDR